MSNGPYALGDVPAVMQIWPLTDTRVGKQSVVSGTRENVERVVANLNDEAARIAAYKASGEYCRRVLERWPEGQGRVVVECREQLRSAS